MAVSASSRQIPSLSSSATISSQRGWESSSPGSGEEAELVIVDAAPLATSSGMGIARLADGLAVVVNAL